MVAHFDAGSSATYVVLKSENDHDVEGMQTVSALLAPGSGYTVGTAYAQIQLSDNDSWEWITRTTTGPNYGHPHDSKTISQYGFDGKLDLSDSWDYGFNRYHEDYAGTYLDPYFLGDVTYNVHGSLDLEFSYDPITGEIRETASSAARATTVSSDGPLKGGIGWSATINNGGTTEHTVLVKTIVFAGVDGTYTYGIGGSGGFSNNPLPGSPTWSFGLNVTLGGSVPDAHKIEFPNSQELVLKNIERD